MCTRVVLGVLAVSLCCAVFPGRSRAATRAWQPQQAAHVLPPELQAARAALDAGDSRQAIELAERYARGHQSDPRGHVVVGDGYAARLPAGLYRAVRAYREACRLDRDNPEPFYKLARVGLKTRGDNGEALAAEGLERVLDLDPLYGRAWDQWLTVYRNSGGRQAMIDRLRPHDSLPAVQAMVGQLLMEEERYDEADSLLASALAADPSNVAWLALRAQSSLEARDTIRGLRYYHAALERAEYDSTGALWKQVVGIATPEELLEWSRGVPPEERRTWLLAFWARRNPDLFAGHNQRIVEHFARLRYARKNYPVLHPLINLDYTRAGRALTLPPLPSEQATQALCETFEFATPTTSGLGIVRSLSPGPSDVRYRPMLGMDALGFPIMEGAVLFPLSFDLNDLGVFDSVGAKTGYNLATGLSDRGLTYLRLGPPDGIVLGGDNALNPVCNDTRLIRWRYRQWGELRFTFVSLLGQRTASEVSFAPRVREQFNTTMVALTEDHSTVPAPLEFGVWTAQFRNTDRAEITDLTVITTQGVLAASLVSPDGVPWETRESRSGIVLLPGAAGRYALLAHGKVGDQLGRQTLDVRLRGFAELPAMSDLLLGGIWTRSPDNRNEMLAHVRHDLTFSPGDTVRSYAEIYGLAAAGGMVRYRATYLILRTGDVARDYARETWPDAQHLAFERRREGAADGVTVETLDILPQWIPAGRYLLRLQVEDLLTQSPVGRATIAFEVR
jgi:tetratricopeptide (TPR) repeat protein